MYGIRWNEVFDHEWSIALVIKFLGGSSGGDV